MTLELRVQLLSDAAPGSGAGGPQVDREVAVDDDGLPSLPGRRLKGLLREAAQEVWEALTLADQRPRVERQLCSVEALFGTPRQASWLQVGNARLAGMAGDVDAGTEAARALADWLTWARERRAIGAGAALAALTVIRRQAAIDAERGAAGDNTLRSTRMLRRGLRFVAPVTVQAPGPETAARAQRTLALAAAALRQLGTSRHRGAGRVRVALWDDRDGDLTAASLRTLEALIGQEASR